MASNSEALRLVQGRDHSAFIHSSTIRFFTIISVVFTLVIANAVEGSTYYIDAATGNDSNPGASDQPWKTLSRAYTWYTGAGSKVQEGDTVLFRNGSYGQFKESTGTNPGENYLFYRYNWITYKADTGHTPVLSDVYICNQDKWEPIEHGRSYIILDGFQITNGVDLLYTSYVQVKNCTVTVNTESYEGYNAPYYAPNTGGIDATTVHYLTVSDCNVSQVCNPLYLGGTNFTITGNTLHHFGEDGIKFKATPALDNVLVENNYIHTCRRYSTGEAIYGTKTGTFTIGETVIQQGTNAEGIVYTPGGSTVIGVYETTENHFLTAAKGGGTVTAQTSGATLSTITLCDASHTDGISIQGAASGIVYRRNIITGSDIVQGLKLEDELTTTVDDILVENNLFYDIYKVMAVTSVTNLRINNNTCLSNSQGLVFSNHNGDTTITEMYNNIIYKVLLFSDYGGYTNRVVSHGNNIFGTNPNGQGGPTYPFAIDVTEAVAANLNALFADFSANDYTLSAGSAATDFGNADYGPSSDVLGVSRKTPPDAGCYEYVSPGFGNHAPVLDNIGNKSINRTPF